MGYDTTPGATNGGFDDVAAELNWTFPAVLQPGNWDAMPDKLKNLSNIQCENCHGPGSQHGTVGGNPNLISVSYSAGDCAQCHSEGTHHIKPMEWANSRHAISVREESASCAECHGGIGFIDRAEGKTTLRTEYSAITCVTCHDPHDATNPHQIRSTGEITLENNAHTVVEGGGMGRLCMSCHRSRRDAASYVTAYHSHFGPHHGPQTDMLMGTNAVDYGQAIPSSGHKFAIQDTCVTCHMQAVGANDPGFLEVGGHTFTPSWDGGTPDNPADDVDLVGACTQCHGPVQSFDIVRCDYDGNGVVEGVQTEVEGLMREVAMLLPPLGQPTMEEVTQDFTPAQLKAAYNYLFVEEDGSMGVHNTAYTVGILKGSIADLKAADGPDTDQDGLPDQWEIGYFGSITAQNGAGDADGDGVSNALEWVVGTNPLVKDSDSDGYNDMEEMLAGNDPLNGDDSPGLQAHIYTAAEFEFASQSGTTYQIQAVTEMNGGWQNVGDPITGDGSMIQRFFSTRSANQNYFRVVELPQ